MSGEGQPKGSSQAGLQALIAGARRAGTLVGGVHVSIDEPEGEVSGTPVS